MSALLLLLFLAVPVLELYVILQVADVIGGWLTIAVLIAESFLGAWLVRREGRRTWQAFQRALEEHRPPGREVADGALVIVGGTLLLTPGFLSDIVGLFALLPITRPLARRLMLRFAARRVGARVGLPFGSPAGRAARRGPSAGRPAGRRPGDPADIHVIDGEVIQHPDDKTPPSP
ncbi:MAG TPA: FxsA family protein [Frankiaceae bacterium]|nr:FxsA family protein [Frankiaceae bacterium]